MKKVILFLFVLLPALVFAQTESESYEIYSKYLHHVKWQCHGKADFVIRESTDYGRKENASIPAIVDELRAWYKRAPSSIFYMQSFDSLMYQIKNDTTWISLLEQLNQTIKQKFKVKNNFPPDLSVSLISNHTYRMVFQKNVKPTENWARFHTKYPMPAYLVDLSKIVSDGKRAVFYFARRWDSRGNTDIIFFRNVDGEWHYLATVTIINY